MEEDETLLEEHELVETRSLPSVRAIFSAIIAMAVLFVLGSFLVFIFPMVFAALVIIFAIRTVARWSFEIDEECDEES